MEIMLEYFDNRPDLVLPEKLKTPPTNKQDLVTEEDEKLVPEESTGAKIPKEWYVPGENMDEVVTGLCQGKRTRSGRDEGQLSVMKGTSAAKVNFNP